MASHLAPNPNHFLFPCSNLNNSVAHIKNNRISHHKISLNHHHHHHHPKPTANNPAKSSHSHPSPELKWKPGIPPPRSSVSVVSDIPRKWCNFVFRRNPDNVLYRSESFRFIQKTNSLEPLIPSRNGFRNKLKLVNQLS